MVMFELNLQWKTGQSSSDPGWVRLERDLMHVSVEYWYSLLLSRPSGDPGQLSRRAAVSLSTVHEDMFQTESSFLVATRGTSQDRRDDENERHSFFLRYIYFVQISEVTLQLTAGSSPGTAPTLESGPEELDLKNLLRAKD